MFVVSFLADVGVIDGWVCLPLKFRNTAKQLKTVTDGTTFFASTFT